MTTPTNDRHIRRSTPDDLPAVLQLYDEAVAWLNAQGITEQWGTTPVSERPHLVKEISDFLGYGMIAQGAEIQSFIAVDFTTPDYFPSYAEQPTVMAGGYVHTLVARRKPIARGVGADLLRWAEQHTQSQGKNYLRLDCWAGNPKLIAYYERRGFVRCGQVAGENWWGQLLEKRLSA
jgi:GNAT superfamily N-acetyltransferase